MPSRHLCEFSPFRLLSVSLVQARHITWLSRATDTFIFGSQAEDEAKYAKLYKAAEREAAQKLEDATQNIFLLRTELGRAKDDAATSRGELARAKAEVAFETQTVSRLNGYLEEQRLQLQTSAEFNEKNQVTALIINHLSLMAWITGFSCLLSLTLFHAQHWKPPFRRMAEAGVRFIKP